MSDNMDKVKAFAKEFNIEWENGETELSFRKRVADEIIERFEDPFLSTSIMTGTHEDDFNEAEESFAYIVSGVRFESKRQDYKSRNDTYYEMPWLDFNSILREQGFIQGSGYGFEGRHPGKLEEASVWVDYKRGILLTASSMAGREIVTAANFHFELYSPKKIMAFDPYEKKTLRDVLGGSFRIIKGQEQSQGDIAVISNDGREGLVDYLQTLDNASWLFQTNNPWQHYDKHHIWLKPDTLLYEDNLKILTADVQRMIGVKE
ncbi:MAG: hypothetical protein KKF46_05905 [Nanoarchaeota archaeon]|nr:hypothetical protein [Nanoarchaeota archaeon]MBU1321867.1 hypothetical protein [Nanoarchaeota archaeon]MBU1597212.1 hypothetical protein [Nanoarchaeota archaeon]MBU2441911.1 hypothetical protein [Nanoarchaeota archaeon]